MIYIYIYNHIINNELSKLFLNFVFQNSFDFEQLPMQQFSACVIAYLTSVGYTGSVFRSHVLFCHLHTHSHII